MPLMPQVSLWIKFYCVRPYNNGILRRVWKMYISCLLPVLSSPLRCATLHTRPRRWAIWRRSSAWRRGLRRRGQGGRRGWWKRCGQRKVEHVRRWRPDGGWRIGWRRSNGWRRVDGVRWRRRRCWGKAGGQGSRWTVWRTGQLALRRGRAEGAWRGVDGWRMLVVRWRTRLDASEVHTATLREKETTNDFRHNIFWKKLCCNLSLLSSCCYVSCNAGCCGWLPECC